MAIKRKQGFTLLEVLITVAVLAILTALAAPSFKAIMDKNTVVAMSNKLLSVLLLARSEAVKRDQKVYVQSLFSRWDIGVLGYVDRNSNGTYDSAEDGPYIFQYQFQDPSSIGSGNRVMIQLVGAGSSLAQIFYNGRGRGSTGSDIYFQLSKNGHTRYIGFGAFGGRPFVSDTRPN